MPIIYQLSSVNMLRMKDASMRRHLAIPTSLFYCAFPLLLLLRSGGAPLLLASVSAALRHRKFTPASEEQAPSATISPWARPSPAFIIPALSRLWLLLPRRPTHGSPRASSWFASPSPATPPSDPPEPVPGPDRRLHRRYPREERGSSRGGLVQA